ncbi:MAG: sodium/glutamate symporter, partial [Gammaproteobacteria bacterium]|nr:sodium/glutamate symporter [Gammaproteobacteria bacterium]
MPETQVTLWQIEPIDVVILSILVQFFGMFLTRRIRFLRDFYIPPAVTGGLICSSIVALFYVYADIEIRFDMQIRDLLLLVFFSTIGLSAKLRVLAAGGKALLVLVVVAGVFLVMQDVTGIALAMLLGAHPGYGLFGGSVSFAGGHGTAIAWGAEAEAAGLVGAGAVGIAFATFGLIAGGVTGGPIARRLIQRHSLEATTQSEEVRRTGPDEPDVGEAGSLYNILRAILLLAICVGSGDLVNRWLFAEGVLLPGFLTSMFVGIVITNLVDLARRPMNLMTIDKIGEVSLALFLSMSLMSMQLWTLADAAGPILLVLIVQVVVITVFAAFITFRLMGRDYDAAVIASGFVGLGLGATPVAIANMNAVTSRFGPS